MDEAYRINAWTFRFRFTIYELDLQLYWDRNGIPSEYYHLTSAEAVQRASGDEMKAIRTGTALCSSVYWESSRREMYCLEYYDLDPLLSSY